MRRRDRLAAWLVERPHIFHSWRLVDVIGTVRFFRCESCNRKKARVW